MAKTSGKITYWNRRKQKIEVEQVYGDASLRWVYESRLGQFLADHVLSKSFVSQLYGAYQSSRMSSQKIQSFIQQFQIPMQEFEEGPFQSFNDFFIRKFKPGYRPFTQKSEELPAFAEARYYAFEKVGRDQKFPVKGLSLDLAQLLGGEERAAPFLGGPLLLARLCPTDYHRFHFPDHGKVLEQYTLHGPLHSVNPVALRYHPEILETNERVVTLLETQNFGRLAYIEVGALCVGKIVQTYDAQAPFHRGDEKGYFLFGGSTVIVVGEPGHWCIEADLLEQTREPRETLVELGQCVARRTE